MHSKKDVDRQVKQSLSKLSEKEVKRLILILQTSRNFHFFMACFLQKFELNFVGNPNGFLPTFLVQSKTPKILYKLHVE
jgi:hypothetical protein